MPVSYQLVIDCRSAETMASFWAVALRYVPAPPPDGYATWDAYLRAVGVPEEDLGAGPDRIADPEGGGPSIWFQVVPDVKTTKNRLHIDVNASGWHGPLDARHDRVDAEVARLVALGATRLHVMEEQGSDFYAVAMLDPEGNEFDIN